MQAKTELLKVHSRQKLVKPSWNSVRISEESKKTCARILKYYYSSFDGLGSKL